MNPGLQIIEKDVVSELKNNLNKARIFYRVFSRIKEISSIEDKIQRKGDYNEKKKMQDIVGIRVITYFYDDVKILYQYLKRCPLYESEQVDIPELTQFKPKRTNLIFRLSPDLTTIFEEATTKMDYDFIEYLDSTYELQLRTIFSEGWHEIDHSLRYKCKQNWRDLYEEERIFNGIFAGLETHDLTLSKLFDDMAYAHFKRKDMHSMIRTKFRLNFGNEGINTNLQKLLQSHPLLVKEVLKLEREDVILMLLNQSTSFPLNLNTFIYFINFFWLKDKSIFSITPDAIMEDFRTFK